MKKKVLIASVLKPVNDARNYEKTGISLAKAGFMVGIAGRKLSTTGQSDPNTEFLPWFDFHRAHFNRLLAPITFFIRVIQYRPDLLIITTWELLLVSCWIRIWLRIPIVYDVQENYFRNLWYSKVYPPLIRSVLAVLVRSIEWVSRAWITQHWIAEKCYAVEIPWLKSAMVVENKARQPKIQSDKFLQKTYLYSGTISKNYGTEEAITWFLQQFQQDSTKQLIVAGYAPDHSFYHQLRSRFAKYSQIQWEGGDTLVNHARIVELLAKCHAGIISYLPDKSTENCIPTKLYEYLSYNLEIVLLSDNPSWEQLIADFKEKPGPQWYWESQEKELLTNVEKCFS